MHHAGHHTSGSLFFQHIDYTYFLLKRHDTKVHPVTESTQSPGCLNPSFLSNLDISPYDQVTSEFHEIYNGGIQKNYQNRYVHSEKRMTDT